MADLSTSEPSTIEAPAAAPALPPAPLSASGTPNRIRYALRRARAALQWRLLLWWALLLLLPALVATLPAWQLLSSSLDYSPFAARLAERLDLLSIADILTAARERHAAALTGGAGVGVVLALLFSPLLTGMTGFAARAARGTPPPGFTALLAGGAHEYGRMLRMLVWAALPLGLALGLGSGALNLAGKVAEKAVLQGDAERAIRLAQLAGALLLMLAHVTLEAGRALLALDDDARPRRVSAVLAWGAACRLLLRRPLALVGLYLAITLPGLGIAALLGVARLNVTPSGGVGLWAAFALTQLIVLVLGWMRAARLFGFIALLGRA